jgi:hypothetical protein
MIDDGWWWIIIQNGWFLGYSRVLMVIINDAWWLFMTKK